MKLVEQPEGSRQCGQACVAMLANTTLEDVVGMVGPRLTKWDEIYSALFQYGIPAQPNLEPVFHQDDLPETSVVIIPTGSSLFRHCVVVHECVVYDPAVGCYPVEKLRFRRTPAHLVLKFASVTDIE